MQVTTLESPPAAHPVEPPAPRRRFRRIAVSLVGLVIAGVTAVGVTSDDGGRAGAPSRSPSPARS